MVTSQEHLYLKGRQALPNVSQPLANLLAPLAGEASIAGRRMAEMLRDPLVRRRLAAGLEAPPSDAASAPLLGLGLGPSKVPPGDKDAFVFPIPLVSAVPKATSTASKCLFLMNLKAGPSCDPKTCPKKAVQFATTLQGRIFSENCAVRKSLLLPWKLPQCFKDAVLGSTPLVLLSCRWTSSCRVRRSGWIGTAFTPKPRATPF
jgi:hypothetical protein